MSDRQYEVGGERTNVPIRLWVAMAAGFVVWLLLVWYGTQVTVARTNREELIGVAIWGVAISFGGLFLVYTWTVAATIIERERLRSTLTRTLSLADQALDEARRLASTDTTRD
jgi:Tfp pilus assembly protein PilN